MGIRTDIYVKSRAAVDAIIECQRDPTLRGLPSKVCDKALQQLWATMKGEPVDSGQSLELPDLFKRFDDHSDKKLRLILELREFLNRQARENLNLKRAYK